MLFQVVMLVGIILTTCQAPKRENRGPSYNERRQLERTDNAELEAKIDQLLSEMTLEEKIGQMTQLNNSTYAREFKPAANESAPPEIMLSIDTTKLIRFIEKYHIGSFFNGIAVSAEKWYEYSKQLQELNFRYSRLKIPIIYGMDHMHGANYLENSTIFPHSINIGATFNTQFSEDEGRILGLETAALGHHWIFGPVLDLGKNPFWPRLYETFGEDPYLCSVMGAAFIKALQGNPEIAPYKQAATAKHYLGYSDPRNGWDRSPAIISDQDLHEFHLPAFKAAVDAGIKTFMINGGDINGIPVHSSHFLLTELLRDQLGFKGVVVTDWEDVIRLHSRHKVARDFKEAIVIALGAGIDMSMTPYTTTFFDSLQELVQEGTIGVDRLDLSVTRILRLKLDLGLFENPFPSNESFDRIRHPEHVKKALNAARESIVLIKNDGVLPLQSPRKIVLAGLNADSKMGLCGGWTLRWIADQEDIFPDYMPTIFTALQQEFAPGAVILADQSDLLSQANDADAVILAIGEAPYAETPGNITDLTLNSDQLDLVRLAQSTGKPVVLIMVAGRPRLITEVLDETEVFIWAGLPGFEGGTAIAEILSGKTNPSGKLPFTYPAYPSHFYPYNHKNMELFFSDSKPEFRNSIAAFGDGLSYTNFEYSDLALSKGQISKDQVIVATVKVSNSGNAPGKEAILWYLNDEVGSVTRPVRQLKAFTKDSLEPGETKEYSFTINPGEHLNFPDKTGRLLLEPGIFNVQVGGLSASFELL